MIRRSVVTDWAFVDAGPLGDTTTVSLYDGATAVPVYSYDDRRARVLAATGRFVIVACGPAAPMPTHPRQPR